MNSAIYSLYDSRGEIMLVTNNTALAIKAAVRSGAYAGALAGGYDSGKVYVLDGRAVVRPELDIQYRDGVLLNVPAGALVSINDIDYEADGTPIELSFEFSTDRTIEVTLWPHQTWRMRL